MTNLPTDVELNILRNLEKRAFTRVRRSEKLWTRCKRKYIIPKCVVFALQRRHHRLCDAWCVACDKVDAYLPPEKNASHLEVMQAVARLNERTL